MYDCYNLIYLYIIYTYYIKNYKKGFLQNQNVYHITYLYYYIRISSYYMIIKLVHIIMYVQHVY